MANYISKVTANNNLYYNEHDLNVSPQKEEQSGPDRNSVINSLITPAKQDNLKNQVVNSAQRRFGR